VNDLFPAKVNRSGNTWADLTNVNEYDLSVTFTPLHPIGIISDVNNNPAFKPNDYKSYSNPSPIHEYEFIIGNNFEETASNDFRAI